MLMLDHTVALVLHGIFSLAGLSGNAFILVVNLMVWRHGRGLTTSDLLVSTVAGFNFCLQGALSINELFFYLWMEFYLLEQVVKPLVVVLVTLFFCSLWSSTWLCVYYCAKIVSYTQHFVVRLKGCFLKAVPWILLGSVLGSAAISIPLAWDIQINVSLNATAQFSGNITARGVHSMCGCLFYIYITASLMAFALFTHVAVSILLSLCGHLRKMAQNADTFRGPRLDAHWGAAKTVTSLLVLNACFYLSVSIIFSGVLLPGAWQYSICVLVMASSPALTCLILIMGNPRLKKALARVILPGKSKTQFWMGDARQGS